MLNSSPQALSGSIIARNPAKIRTVRFEEVIFDEISVLISGFIWWGWSWFLDPAVWPRKDWSRLKSKQADKWLDYNISDAEYIKAKIASGEWGMTVNFEKQAPHMESTRAEGKSYLFDTEKPQQNTAGQAICRGQKTAEEQTKKSSPLIILWV